MIGSNICQYTTICINTTSYIPLHTNTHSTYHYIQIQTNTIPNELFHLVSIGLYCVCSIQTNTCHYIPNTCQYILILNTNGDETRRNNRYGLACIWYVFSMYLVCIRMYQFVFACIAPRLTLRVLPPFVFRIGMYWHVFGMYEHVLVCTLQTQYRPILTI